MSVAVRTGKDHKLWERALIASLAIHLIIALFLPAWMPKESQGLQPVESISFAHLIRIEIARPHAGAPAVAVPRTIHHAQRVSFARQKTELSVHRKHPTVRPTAVEGPAGKVAAAPKPVRLQRAAPLYARAPATAMPVTVTSSVARETPQPQASVENRQVAGAGTADRGGVLPFGATQDPVLDPGVLAQLQKLYSHVTLLVTVDENGRTKSVDFQPPLDPQAEQRIEALLASANWDAAVCGGGVSCQGVATIKL